jgi:hypothetical protein
MELPFEVDAAVAQQAMQDLDALGEALEAMREGIAEGVVFTPVIAGTDTEYQAAVADLIHRIGHLGEQRGIAKPHA